MKCGNDFCEADAVWRVFWPGKESVMCERHANMAQGIASAMGFELARSPLSDAVNEGGGTPRMEDCCTRCGGRRVDPEHQGFCGSCMGSGRRLAHEVPK